MDRDRQLEDRFDRQHDEGLIAHTRPRRCCSCRWWDVLGLEGAPGCCALTGGVRDASDGTGCTTWEAR